MSTTAPSDLAVAFRSFARRLREALGQAEDDEALAAAGAPAHELEALVQRVASQLHVPAGSDLAGTGRAIADAIDATPADAWTDASLRALEQDALEAGRLLRQVEAAGSNRHD